MNLCKHTLFLLAAVLAVSCATARKAGLEAVPFEMPRIQEPVIPGRCVTVTDFGGVGDGVALNTEAFARAIGSLADKGGGTLVVPAGIWRTGPIGLQSHIRLQLDKGAIVVFDPDQSLYPIINTNFEGLDVRRCLSPLHAENATDIAITGEGVFDGSGSAWREVKKRKVGDDLWKPLVKGGGVLSDDGKVWFPDEGYKKARATAGSLNKPSNNLDEQEIKTFLRPVLVSLRGCERILLEGVTFQDSPCWNVHPLWCKHLTVRNVNIRNPHYSTNGDGIDIESCENVHLVGSTFDVGDDAICIKSGKDEDGRRHGIPCRNLVIEDCTVYHGHGGFVIGSEMSGGVENVLVRNCRFMGTDVGLRFKSTRGRGGLVRGIWCDHIYMKDIVADAVLFNLYYAGVAATEKAPMADPAGKNALAGANKKVEAPSSASLPPVDETTPEFRDFHFSHLLCAGAAQAITINGLPELPLKGVSFRDCQFTARKGVEIQYSDPVLFENVTVNGETL